MTVKYVTDLMEKNYEAVGFLPRPRIEAYDQAGQLWLQTENDDPCGYLIFGRGWPVLRVYQCCIQVDARRREHAAQLVNRLIAQAEREGYSAISLYCADDLEANSFWPAMGFQFGGTRDNGNRRGRLHNNWVYWVSKPWQPDLFRPIKPVKFVLAPDQPKRDPEDDEAFDRALIDALDPPPTA